MPAPAVHVRERDMSRDTSIEIDEFVIRFSSGYQILGTTWGGAREGESVVIVNVTLLSIICGGASCRGQDLSGWCPAAVGMCSTPMGGPPQLWMTKLRVSCGFYELVVTPPTEKR